MSSAGGLGATLPRVAKAEYTLGDQLDVVIRFTKYVERKNHMPSSRFPVAVMILTVMALWWVQSVQKAAAQVPEENRKQVVEALGPPFIVFRDKVLDELNVTDEQREKLMEHVRERIMETGPFLESLAEAGQEREKKLNEHKKNGSGEARQIPEGSARARTTEAVAAVDASGGGRLCAWARTKSGKS